MTDDVGSIDPESTWNTGFDSTGPTSELAWAIFRHAVRERASDVHLDATAAGYVVRLRVDGILRDVATLPCQAGQRLVNHLKVLAELDFVERRRPQDGRIWMALEGRNTDLRVATAPTLYGEKVVVRLFDPETRIHAIQDLGLLPQEKRRFQDLIRSPHGLILITGPTGAGKTTTLYTILNEINSSEKNIVTVEDPIEYDVDRINQIGVHRDFDSIEALRCACRQDPDVLMIGEIRDTESADIAIRAASSGHLVLSTLHTATATGAISALLCYGIDPYLLAGAVAGVVTQQLVRVICPECRTAMSIDLDDLAAEQKAEFVAVLEPGESPTFCFGAGCESCHESGYRGRTGIFEILRLEDRLAARIASGAGARELETTAKATGMESLRRSGFRRIVRGQTTVEEVLRVVPVPDELEVGTLAR